MSMSNNSHIQEIMLRYLNGESTEDEYRKLQEWINENNNNKNEFELTQRLWTDSKEAVLFPVDIDKAWQKINAKTTEKITTKVVPFPWKKTLSIAASVIIITGIFYIFFQPGETKWKTILAQNANKEFQLPDGTKISLRKGSKLSVPENYGDVSRKVLLEGEAFFTVQHNASNPFSIQTSRSIIQDIGTAFLVHNDDSLDQVSVLEGEVNISSISKKDKPLSLLPGETAIMQNSVLQKQKVDTTNLLSWKTQTLVFHNTALFTVARDLKDYFQADFRLTDAVREVPITAEFHNDSLEQVVNELRLLTGLKIEIKGKTVMISK